MQGSGFFRFLGIGLLLGVLVTACGRSTPPPTAASVNGVTGIDRSRGSAEFSVSGLNARGGLVTSGNVGFGSAMVNQAGFSVGGSVCGGGAITNSGPITGALTLDASGSMSSTDPSRRRAVAAKAFVQRMEAGDVATVTAFEGNRHYRFADFTSDKAELFDAIDNATYAGGNTPLWDSSYGIVSDLANRGGSNLMALVFTDGLDTGGKYRPNDVIAHARTEGVRLYMVGLGSPGSVETTNMINISTQTGGLYSSTTDSAALEMNFTNIFSASKASGCIGLTFDPPPASKQTMTGNVTFTINGRPFSGDYEVTF